MPQSPAAAGRMMLARLGAHVAGQQRFAANASHELRTPLAITQSLLEVARADRPRRRRAPQSAPRRQRPTVGSHALLLQLSTNLLHNAIVHTRPDDGSVWVTTSRAA
jgi:two-component system sensor histidine kinase VanS